ncbi:hypothetical protein ZHAS_00004193 [Anopheles sinensis]|uniref:Uncharacterized protein n=1 Tax=Anopheles sinensis TaxID=74873 RepID=A0A084VGA1_ANOSI|nr:hypothetical protein ZHAS_00004193 [Anopheles sinensis]
MLVRRHTGVGYTGTNSAASHTSRWLASVASELHATACPAAARLPQINGPPWCKQPENDQNNYQIKRKITICSEQHAGWFLSRFNNSGVTCGFGKGGIRSDLPEVSHSTA